MPIKDQTPDFIKDFKFFLENVDRFSKKLDIQDIYFILDMEGSMKIHSDIFLNTLDNHILIFKNKQDKKWSDLIHVDNFQKN